MHKLYILCFYILRCVSGEAVNVQTSVGIVTGQTNDGYNTFFGVPYAKVDEDNPFGKSIAYPKFKTPFNANDSTIRCPQATIRMGQLQCLRLNIYVPETATANNKVPVMVWFHGGSFIAGQAGQYGGEYLTKLGIILIAANYRLGPYGFFCLDDPTVPGNQGLKDQIEALRWVKKNIAAFGGDPDKVTIAGESAGGCAVDLHLYSEYETLFSKAIVQSGSIFTDGLFLKPDYQAAVKIAKFLGHNVTETRDALAFLAQDDSRAVMLAAVNLSLSLGACNEKHFRGVKNFISHNPFQLHKPDRVKNTKIMIGYTSMEGILIFANQPEEFYVVASELLNNIFKRNFDLKNRELEILYNIWKEFYLGGKGFGPESLLELSDASSDFIINHGMERTVDKYMKVGTTIYKYLFSYIGDSLFRNISGAGAAHGEELKYLFRMEALLVTAEQKMIRDRMTTLWANFVKFGNPTPRRTTLLPIKWSPVTNTSSRPYMNIDVEMSMGDYVFQQRMAFLDLLWHAYKKCSVLYHL